MENYSEIEPRRFIAIKKSIELGEILIKDHPEIADFYRAGIYLSQIVKKINGKIEYGYSDIILSKAVGMSISGHRGGFGVEAYEGLIPDEEEREKLRKEHMVKNGRERGKELFKEGRGIHGLTSEEHIEFCRIGGTISGNKLFEEGRGIHAQSEEERKEYNLQAILAKGMTPWGEDEKKYAYELSLKEEYQYPLSSSHQGKPLIEKIRRAINTKYHGGKEVRSADPVSHQICLYRKSLENNVE